MSKKKKIKSLQQLSHFILETFKKNPQKPLNYKQVSRDLGINKPETRKLVLAKMEDLTEKGKLEKIDRNKYKLKLSYHYLEGIIDFTQTGNAYVIVDGLDQDIFIHRKYVKNALPGDKVKIRIPDLQKSKRRQEGEVIEVLERNKTQFVGTAKKNKNFYFVVPDDANILVDFYVPNNKAKNARSGEKVIVKFVDWPEDYNNPFGEIVEVLGLPGNNDVEAASILIDNGFSPVYPKEVIKEAEKIPLSIPKQEIKKRRDFRNITTFTIDPHDAKDFDDALSVQFLENGDIEVGVHIADVTHYIPEESALDKEALKRSTSVYLVDRVIPMLPEVLSNEVCSLKPKEDKLCFSAVFTLNNQAEIVKEWFGKTVIHSDKRFTYEEAQNIIENKNGLFHKELSTLNSLAKKLREKRKRQGSITFDKIEVQFQLNDKGEPIGVQLKESKDSNKLIEEFMLLANKRVSEFVTLKIKEKPPYVYRVHDYPDPVKLEEFKRFIAQFGYAINVTNLKKLSDQFNQLFEKIKDKNEEAVIETLAIRTMAKAYYSTNNIGHYGLGFPYYSHFTSPIRRYPDILAHRLLFAYLNKNFSSNKHRLEEMCKHASKQERLATQAERDSIKFFQVKLMNDKIGEIYEGVISGITEYGIFVELKDNLCEGLIRTKELKDDFYVFDEENYRLIGKDFGKVYQLGDEIIVKVAKVNLIKRQIDFLPMG